MILGRCARFTPWSLSRNRLAKSTFEVGNKLCPGQRAPGKLRRSDFGKGDSVPVTTDHCREAFDALQHRTNRNQYLVFAGKVGADARPRPVFGARQAVREPD